MRRPIPKPTKWAHHRPTLRRAAGVLFALGLTAMAAALLA